MSMPALIARPVAGQWKIKGFIFLPSCVRAIIRANLLQDVAAMEVTVGHSKSYGPEMNEFGI
jgi:hypothetical protein